MGIVAVDGGVLRLGVRRVMARALTKPIDLLGLKAWLYMNGYFNRDT
jgi:hypothetical protein